MHNWKSLLLSLAALTFFAAAMSCTFWAICDVHRIGFLRSELPSIPESTQYLIYATVLWVPLLMFNAGALSAISTPTLQPDDETCVVPCSVTCIPSIMSILLAIFISVAPPVVLASAVDESSAGYKILVLCTVPTCILQLFLMLLLTRRILSSTPGPLAATDAK
jgi:hypothetical protein